MKACCNVQQKTELGVAISMNTNTSVSYTHLDVYKRQAVIKVRP